MSNLEKAKELTVKAFEIRKQIRVLRKEKSKVTDERFSITDNLLTPDEYREWCEFYEELSNEYYNENK